MYKQTKDIRANILLNAVIRIKDNVWIPADHDNTDYQAYLIWLSEGNTPEPADE